MGNKQTHLENMMTTFIQLASFWNKLGKQVPECLYSGFYWSQVWWR